MYDQEENRMSLGQSRLLSGEEALAAMVRLCSIMLSKNVLGTATMQADTHFH